MGNCASTAKSTAGVDTSDVKAKTGFRWASPLEGKTSATMVELRICVDSAIDSFAKAGVHCDILLSGQNGGAKQIFGKYKTDLTKVVDMWDANKTDAAEVATALKLVEKIEGMCTPVKQLFSVSLDEERTGPVPSNVLGQAIGKSFLAYKNHAPGDKWAEAMASSTEKEWNTESGSIGDMLRFLNGKAEQAVATLDEHDEVLKAKGFQIMTKAMLEGANQQRRVERGARSAAGSTASPEPQNLGPRSLVLHAFHAQFPKHQGFGDLKHAVGTFSLRMGSTLTLNL